MSSNKKAALCRQFRQAFFTELSNFLDQLVELLPDEATDLIVYRALVRQATGISTQEWFLDCFRYYVTDKFSSQIMAKDLNFFKSNHNDLLGEHQNTKYGDEATDWIRKIKKLWQEGRIDKDHQEWVWTFMQTFTQLAIKEKQLRAE
jgi:hypothetical protein